MPFYWTATASNSKKCDVTITNDMRASRALLNLLMHLVLEARSGFGKSKPFAHIVLHKSPWCGLHHTMITTERYREDSSIGQTQLGDNF